jgi:hypothetical protein
VIPASVFGLVACMIRSRLARSTQCSPSHFGTRTGLIRAPSSSASRHRRTPSPVHHVMSSSVTGPYRSMYRSMSRATAWAGW